ncbi:MAG: glycosyltransferase family A protein [Nitrososphaera sp.]|jgi:glycosyltransferase involved in cell wall biosynthesis
MARDATYWVIVTVKNGQKTINDSLLSILNQSTPPSLLCVVDDGSKDATPKILEKLVDTNPSLKVITLPDKGYDIRRIVHNWNAACEYKQQTGREFDFLLISSDDVIFPRDYASRLIDEMRNNTRLAIVSGTRELKQSDYLSLPEGAGRMIRESFFEEVGYRHPPYYGYEAWILYKAMQSGYQVKKISDLRYEHTRSFGTGHNWIEYGPAMRCLGYHPLFVFARVLRNVLGIGGTGISKRASMRMLVDYFFEGKWKHDPYFHYFEPELRHFVRRLQTLRLRARMTGVH